jgi:hypothetical protein
MSLSGQEAALRGVDAVGADVWTNLANVRAMKAASTGPTTTVAKKAACWKTFSAVIFCFCAVVCADNNQFFFAFVKKQKGMPHF